MIGLSGILMNLSTAAIVSLSPQYPASYQMEAKLDTADNNIYGNEEVEFLNPTPDTLEQICFHLYPNAFKDTASVFCRENSQMRAEVASGNTSHLDVTDLAIDGQTLDSTSLNLSGTLLYVKLPARLPPGGTISITLKFELKIPKVLMRIGYNNQGNYLLSHWHPILCGYQKGVLQDFEYHANSEFFSDFSSYDVKLDIPSGFKVGSTGELTQVSSDSSRTVWQAHADTVIDFAFVCGPAFEVSESDTMGINLRYLIEKRHKKYRPVADAMTKYSLSYDSEKFYKYPYKTFTLVDFQAGAAGIELPGMAVITFPSTRIFSFGKKMLYLTIAHEITHEWFYATIATNEALEPWLDEGVTSYITDRIMESAGDTVSEFDILGIKFSYFTFERLAALMSKAEYPIDLKSWDYPDEMAYGTSVYYRASLVFKTLEELLGQAKMDSVLGAYAREYRFRHPDSKDFENAIAANAGAELRGFYSQFVSGTARVDYSVRLLSYKSIIKPDNSKKYEVTLNLARELDGVLPHNIFLTLENGTKIDTTWDGASRLTTIKFQTNSRPSFISLGHDNAYALDENIANNTHYQKSFGLRLLSFEWDTVFSMEFFLSFIL